MLQLLILFCYDLLHQKWFFVTEFFSAAAPKEEEVCQEAVTWGELFVFEFLKRGTMDRRWLKMIAQLAHRQQIVYFLLETDWSVRQHVLEVSHRWQSRSAAQRAMKLKQDV